MKITKDTISRDKANELAPDYVKWVEDKSFDAFDRFEPLFNELKKGDKVLTYADGEYVIAKVSKVDWDTPQAIDGPVVRVGNGEFTWRVDGAEYACPLS